MGKPFIVLGLVVYLGLSLGARAADPISFATTEPGNATYAAVLALSQAAATYSGMDVRPRPFKSTTQGIPVVNTGEVSFGMESAVGLNLAYSGQGAFIDQPQSNLRLVATIYPFRASMLVRDSDPAQNIADLKGHKIGVGYRAAPNIDILVRAMLASGGLTYDDIVGTPVSVLPDGQDGFVSGAFDAGPGFVNSPSLTQMAQNAGGKIRMLNLGTDPEAEAAVKALVPNGRIIMVEPTPGFDAVYAPTSVLEYDFFIYASAATPDEAVVGVLDALIKGYKEMEASVPGYAWFHIDNISSQIGIPYHPAAEAHLKELGLWKGQ